MPTPFQVWKDANLKWEPNEFDDIQDVNNVDLRWSWTPEFTVVK